MAKVIRDLVSEYMGSPSIVGTEVEVVVLIPKNTALFIVGGGKVLNTFANTDVYLVKASSGRVYATDNKGIPIGDPIASTIYVEIEGKEYKGNELLAPSEIELDA